VWRRLPGPTALGKRAARALWRARRGFAAAAIAVTAAGAGHVTYRWITGSQRFAVAAIEVEGNQELSDAEVRERAGLAAGTNLFRADLGAIERRLEADPWIVSAAAHRAFPDRVVVEVEEHHAAALVELGALYLADDQGHVFKRADLRKGDGPRLPIISGIEREQYTAHPAVARAEIRAALEAARIYRKKDDRPPLGEIRVDPRRGVTLVTYDTATSIRVGDGGREALEARLRAFDAAWAALSPAERRVARVFYVNHSNRPDRVTVGMSNIRAED
jgi:cell division protein FtsQ